MSYSIKYLLGEDARNLRQYRAHAYREASEKLLSDEMDCDDLRFVVHVETSTNFFVELDAASQGHAENLRDHWIKQGRAISGAIRAVDDRGDLGKIIGRIVS